MKLLPLTLSRKGFQYNQVIRKAGYAIYEQWRFGRIVAYECFKIMSHEDYEIAGQLIPAAESMPSDSQWGVFGWTYPTKEAALKRLAKLLQKERAK